jgi:NADH-quinone oxidoreductase subunit K
MILVSSLILICGMFLILIKKSKLLQLIGLEIMLNAANINLVYFDNLNKAIDGQVLTAFVIIVSACEVVLGLGIVIQLAKITSSEKP